MKGINESLVEKSLQAASDQPTEQAWEEKQSYTDQVNELRIREFRENLTAKKKYAHLLFIMLCFWLGIVLIFLLLQGISKVPWTDTYRFELSEAVLITLITTTTANVAGFFFVVVNHLFPGNEKNTLKN